MPVTPQAQATMQEADYLAQQATIDIRLARQQVAAAKAEQAARDQQAALDALRSETGR